MADNSRGRYKGMTEARKRACSKYHKKIKSVNVRVPPEVAKRIEDICASSGESIGSYIRRAIRFTMSADPLGPGQNTPGSD